MREEKPLKVNIGVIFKAFILLGFAFFFCTTLLSGTVSLYISPKFTPYVIFTTVVMFLLSGFVLKDLFNPRGKKADIGTCAVFIIPLVIAFLVPPTTMNSTSASVRRLNIDQNVSLTTDRDQPSGVQNSSASEPEPAADTIIVDSNNFIYWLGELYTNFNEYNGKKVDITGFVLKEESFTDNELVVARFIMICCAADVQVSGILCHYEGASAFEPDTWVNVTGEITSVEYQGKKIPAIVADKIKQADRPRNEYVYF